MPSMRYESMEEGGRTPAGVYRFTEAQFAQYQFGTGGRAFCFVSNLIGEDNAVHEQAWLAGNIDDFSPDQDGQTWKPIGKRTAFRKDSGFGQLAKSHAEAGFPYAAEEEADTTGNLYENLVAYMDWVDDAGRRYRCRAEACGIYFDTPEQCMAHQKSVHNDDTPVRKGQNFLIQSIVSLPSEWKGEMGGTGAGQTAGATPAATGAPATTAVRRRPTAAAPSQPSAPAAVTQPVAASDSGTETPSEPAASTPNGSFSDADFSALQAAILGEIPDGGSLPISALRTIVWDPNKPYRADRGQLFMQMLTKPAVCAEVAEKSDGLLVLDGNSYRLAN